ncbi:hypothetical protein [uncultured Paraglaciecola sp.]|uniref:hypothetical protein n=1 Tax=uncultured Paraglaciecola sp. TaxID=1765024 RepID=UPI0025941A2E|nr:hypothetical protein [uncultured Paraglaciecola sp.]
MKYLTPPLVISSILFLAACSDDADNSALVAALEEQNQILSEQEEQINTVAIRGRVVDQYDDLPPDSAVVTVKVGEQTLTETTANEGFFEVTDLPVNSDIEIIISSDSEEFMTRVFYYNTGESTSGEAQKDFGNFAVSESTEVTLTVLDNETDEAITGLIFSAGTAYGEGSTSYQYIQYSSYDEVNQYYTISIPKYITTIIEASLDTNDDDIADYTYYYGYDSITLVSSTSLESEILYVSEVEQPDVIAGIATEYRVSVVGESGQPIPEAQITVDDNLNDNISSTYDADTGQHVINAQFYEAIDLQMPAFSVDGIYYESAYIGLDEQSDGTLRVYFSNTNNDSYSYYIDNAESITLALQPDEDYNYDTILDVVFAANEVDYDNQFTVFYSQPVTITADDVSLIDQDGFEVIKGDADSNDLVLPGSTLISGDIEVEVSVELSLNNTRLVVTPASELTSGNQYYYSVGNILVDSTDINSDLSEDALSFYPYTPASVDTDFDINDLYLDNNNYNTNGTLINPQNTAGEDSTYSDRDSSVYLFLPDSVSNLQGLTLRQVQVIEDGEPRIDITTFDVIEDGVAYNLNKYGLVSLAYNEDVTRDSVSRSLLYGTSLEDSQKAYFINTYESISDDLDSSENSISFEYAYETNEGEVFTGTITLPVH